MTELGPNAFFDLKTWERLEHGTIINESILENELQNEKDRLNDFLRKFIFDKYKHETAHSALRKTHSGYSLSRRFAKNLNMGCKRSWNVRIDINEKSAYLDTRCSCTQFLSLNPPAAKR